LPVVFGRLRNQWHEDSFFIANESTFLKWNMKTSRGYRDLVVWKRSLDLAELLYKQTATFPKEETYGMTSQIRRAAVSVSANIAEGAERNTPGEFKQFLGIAKGSLAELETLIMLAARLGLTTTESAESSLQVCEEVGKMLNGLQKSIIKS
jgi:four helix bundle protein